MGDEYAAHRVDGRAVKFTYTNFEGMSMFMWGKLITLVSMEVQ